MKKFLCSFAAAGLTLNATAHDSIIPHTHSTSRDNSDAFIGTFAALALLAVTVVLFRALRRSRQA